MENEKWKMKNKKWIKSLIFDSCKFKINILYHNLRTLKTWIHTVEDVKMFPVYNESFSYILFTTINHISFEGLISRL